MEQAVLKTQSYFSSNDISKDVVDSAFYVYKQMGTGILESVYEECLCYTLEKRQIPFERQKPISVFMDGQDMGIAFKADVIVDNCLILEIKSVEKLNDVHTAQLLNYMRLSGIKTGFLMNFNERMFKDGIRRFML